MKSLLNRVTVITLGVKDMNCSLRFYRDGLDFATDVVEENPGIVFFSSPGVKLALYPLNKLAEDINPATPPQGRGFGGITLACNVPPKCDVNVFIEKARVAGATIVLEPEDAFWGGYHAYFADPDGYYWEIAWGGPMFQYDEHDLLVL